LEDDEEGDGDDNTDYTHPTDGGLIPSTTGYFADSADNLLLTGAGNDGAPYLSPNTQFDFGGPQNRGVWDSDYNKKAPGNKFIELHSPRDAAKEKKLLMLLSKSLRLRAEDTGYGLCGLRPGGCRISCYYGSLDV
jgi:hypothetical protein